MLRVVLILVMALPVISPPLQARIRAAGSPIDRAGAILVVIAHPDDEVLIAPLLELRCVRGGARCAFLVMTTGEGGTCVRPSGCSPSLGVVRAGEMARSAAHFHAALTQWDFPDIFQGVDAAWAAHAGGREILLRRLRDAIALEHPDVVITFNPDHGSTGHEAHRTIGALVRETGFAAIWTIETRAAVAGDAITLWNGAPERASVLHANELWDALVRTVEMHESQFTPGQRDTLRTLPHEQRCVWWTAEP